MYMDDIKIYAGTLTHLQGLLKITEKITKDIGMEFGTSKCKLLHIEKGKWKREQQDEKLNNEEILQMEKHELYKYLGFHQNRKLEHTALKKSLQQHYKDRLGLLLKSKLNSKNLFKAINTFAVPILTYSFGIIKWSRTDLENIHILTRAQLTKSRKLHPNSCKERLTLSRKEGGRGMIDLTELHANQIKALRTYFQNKCHPLHESIRKIDKNYTPINLAAKEKPEIECMKELKIQKWSTKELHSRHYNNVNKEHISKEHTYKFLQKGQLFPETEGFILAIQDQIIPTNNYKKYIMKDKTIIDDNCRKCHLSSETIEHITSACKLLASNEYTNRHNTAAKIIHQAIALKYHLHKDAQPYYTYSPQTILENKDYKMYWDLTIHTDKTIRNNRPDITLQDKINKVTYLIDIAVPSDHNVLTKYREKKEKYQDLAVEVERVWKQKQVYIIPFIISVTGITPHSFIKHLSQISLGEHIHTHVQKAVILHTCNIVRSFLNQK